MKPKPIFLLFYITLVTLFIFSGCSAVSLHKTVKSSSAYSLDRVLIVGLTNNYDSRLMYEKELSYRLRDMGYNMFSGINVNPEKKELYTLDEIIALVKEKEIDAVVTMRLKEVKSEERYTTSDRYISDAYNMHNYFFNYVDTYYNVYSWSYQPQQTVVIEANLFDAKSQQSIYRVEATMKNAESEEVRAGEVTQGFANSLSKSGFLKKQ